MPECIHLVKNSLDHYQHSLPNLLSMYDLLSLEVWSITFPVGLQIQHAEDLTTFSPFPSAALTTAFGPELLHC
ncbi:hypothetical protein Tco_0881836 [Tanacetum coccineum]